MADKGKPIWTLAARPPGQCPELDQLRAMIAALVSELSIPRTDAVAVAVAAAVARERAELLGAELAETQPDGSRVRRLWQRLRAALESITVPGANTAGITTAVARLF